MAHANAPAPQVGDGLHPAPDLNRQAYVFIPDGIDPQAREFYELLERMLTTHATKNKDYADSEDRFANFRESEGIGVPAYRGAFIRSGDKYRRVRNLIRREAAGAGGPAVVDESVEDTLMDLAVYSLIVLQLHREWKASIT